MYSFFSEYVIFRKFSYIPVVPCDELSHLIKTSLCKPAYDKVVSYSVCSHGCVQLSSQSAFSLDRTNSSKRKTSECFGEKKGRVAVSTFLKHLLESTVPRIVILVFHKSIEAIIIAPFAAQLSAAVSA